MTPGTTRMLLVLEIKAFIRVNMVDRVLQALEGVGVSNITVIDVRAIWTSLKDAPSDCVTRSNWPSAT